MNGRLWQSSVHKDVAADIQRTVGTISLRRRLQIFFAFVGELQACMQRHNEGVNQE